MINLTESILLTKIIEAIKTDYSLKGHQNLLTRERQILDLCRQVEKMRAEESHPDTESCIHAQIEICLHASKKDIARLLQGDSSIFTKIISRGYVTIDENNVENMYVPQYCAECWTEENELDVKYGKTVD